MGISVCKNCYVLLLPSESGEQWKFGRENVLGSKYYTNETCSSWAQDPAVKHTESQLSLVNFHWREAEVREAENKRGLRGEGDDLQDCDMQ